MEKLFIGLTNIAALVLLQSCMSEIKPKDVKLAAATTIAKSGYSGCTVATGLSTSTVQVSFAFPANATEVSVTRDGLNILTTRNRLNTSLVDINLQEGQTYRYECVATVNGILTIGDRAVDGTTLAVNPPVFSGIDSVTAISANSVRVNWPPSNGGSVAKEYKIFGTMNATVNFVATPKATSPVNTYTAVISGLADDMPYHFAVRACNSSGICDANVKEIILTMPDRGAANTVGAASAALFNGVAQITAPWEEANGAVLKRRLYRANVNDVNTILTNLIKTVNVSIVADLANPPTVLEDNTIAQSQTYYYLIRDEDPSGNITTSTNVVSLSIGDLTAPVFSGLTSIALDAPDETSVLLGWTAINNQPADANGATYYLLYKTEATLPASPANSCSAGTLYKTLNSSSYSAGAMSSYKVTGLTSRKKYNFCLKAQDAALNISNTLSFRDQLMPDLTAPQFDGIQNVSYDVAVNKFTMVWNPSSSSDIYQYKVKVWKNTVSPNPAQITTITYNASTNPSSAIFGTTEFNFSDGDTVFMLVNACDNASPTFNTVDNCTSFANSSAISRNLIDITPPPGFLGVSGTTPMSQGIIRVNWNLPADKSDYAGFKIYNIEETSLGVFTKVFLADTYCVSNDCATNPLTSYNLSVSRHYHTYNIFVSAVDLLGNETRATDPIGTLTYSQVTSIDSSTPNFTSSLASAVSGGNIVLTWNNATDNQYAKKNVSTTNTIKYEIYRKEGATTFNSATYINGIPDYVNDATIVRVATGLLTTTYNDSTATLTQGQTYNYTVCARDESSNVRCDGLRAETLNDNLAPVIETVRVDEIPNSSSWNLDIKVSDGVKAPGTVIVYVYAKYSDGAGDFPDGTGGQVSAALTGAGTVATPAEFVFYQDFLSNTSTYHYVNYFIKAVDAASNVSTSTYSHIIRRPTIAAATLGYVLNEDVLTTVTLTTTGLPGSDLSGANLSYELVTPPGHGTLSNCMNLAGTSGGQDLACQYLTNANYFGADSFTYRVKDNLPMNSENVVTVNLTINNVNDTPVATNVTTSVLIAAGNTVNTTATLNVTSFASDPDNDMVPGTNILSVVTNSPAMTPALEATSSCTGQNCIITYGSYKLNKFGTSSFPYQIADDTGETSSIGTITLRTYSQWTWIGGIDNDYNKPANWCGSLDGNGNCLGAGTIPPANAHLVFSDLCINCNVTIPSTVSLNSVVLSSTFGGIVTVANGVTLTVKLLETNKGTFDATSAASFINPGDGSSNASFAVKDTSTFKAPSTNMTVSTTNPSSGFFSVASTSTFIHNGGTVTIKNLHATLPGGLSFLNKTFYNLIIDNTTYNSIVTAGGSSYTVQNDLTVKNGILTQTGTARVVVGGNLNANYVSATNYGDISGLATTLIGTNSYINMQNTAMSAGYITVDQVGMAYSSTADLVLNNLKIKDGTFTAPTGTLSVKADLSMDNTAGALPVFNHNGGTVRFINNIAANMPNKNCVFSVPITLNHMKVEIGYAWGAIVITGTINVLGNLAINNTSNSSDNNIFMNPGSIVNLYGNLTLNRGSYEVFQDGRKGASVKLVGTNNQTVTGGINVSSYIGDITIDKPSGNVSFFNTLAVTQNLNLNYTNGAVNMGTSSVYVGRHAGVLQAGSTEFYDLTLMTMYGSTTTITGDVIVKNKFVARRDIGGSISGGRILLGNDFEYDRISSFTTDLYFVGTGTQNISWFTGATYPNSNMYFDKPSGAAVFLTQFDLASNAKNISLLNGTLDFNGQNVQVSRITTEPGTVANSWSTLTKSFWTNNGGTQNP